MTRPRWFLLVPVTVLVLAGCSSSRKAAVTSTTTTPSTTASSTTSTTGGPATTTTVPAGGPLPHGFKVADLTWISDSDGWALGAAPCAHAPCTSVAHTIDGGHTWAGLPALIAYLPGDAPAAGCNTPGVACVQGIRFANANVGYAFGPSSLWLTTNGGQSWTERSTDGTDALEVDGGIVFRISHAANVSPPGVPYQVQSAPVGTTMWHTLSAPSMFGDGAALAVQGADVYAAVLENPAGGAQDEHSHLERSTDGGAVWSALADPCGVTTGSSEADTTAIAAAPGGYLAAACTARLAGQAGFVVESTNAGATFGPHRGGLLNPLPADERLEAIAAPTGQRLAVIVAVPSGADIVVSTDSGAHWAVTRSDTLTASPPFLGFEDTVTGRAVLNPPVILTTTDGGAHWAQFAFP